MNSEDKINNIAGLVFGSKPETNDIVLKCIELLKPNPDYVVNIHQEFGYIWAKLTDDEEYLVFKVPSNSTSVSYRVYLDFYELINIRNRLRNKYRYREFITEEEFFQKSLVQNMKVPYENYVKFMDYMDQITEPCFIKVHYRNS